MESKNKIIILIAFLLFVLSATISTVNYLVSLKTTQTQLKTQGLALSVDNIYTEIQKNMIEPYLVSSMMANNTFLKNWLVNNEQDEVQITNYLSTIKDKYQLLTTFLVSMKTGKHYTNNGFLKKIDKNKRDDQWYFKFMQNAKDSEINLDFNKNLDNNLIMFMHFKIKDKENNFIGATGVGLKVTYINEMLETFEKKYLLNVYFLDSNGEIVLHKQDAKKYKSIDDMKELKEYKSTILSKKPSVIQYNKGSQSYILQTKYIPELDIHLMVEAKIDDFSKDAKKTLYFNIAISFVFTFIIILIVIAILKKYHKKLEDLANFDVLTKIKNRRSFKSDLEHFIKLHTRNKRPLSLVFIDIDDFKSINDNFSHKMGDEILIQVANILSNNIRKTDLVARWGGEEFIITFIDTNINDAYNISQKIRKTIQNDEKIKKLLAKEVTASFGLTVLRENDTLDAFVSRADKAMYQAKEDSKNKVSVIP